MSAKAMFGATCASGRRESSVRDGWIQRKVTIYRSNSSTMRRDVCSALFVP
jgi:hypothetical protein